MGSSPFLEIILQQYCDRYGHSSLKFVYRSVILWDVPYLPRGEQKRSNRFAVSPEADLAQLTAPTQKIRSSKNIRGLKAVFDQKITPLLKKNITQFSNFV